MTKPPVSAVRVPAGHSAPKGAIGNSITQVRDTSTGAFRGRGGPMLRDMAEEASAQRRMPAITVRRYEKFPGRVEFVYGRHAHWYDDQPDATLDQALERMRVELIFFVDHLHELGIDLA